MKATDRHRDAYKLIVRNPRGVTREELAESLGVSDRVARAIIEDLRVLAAENPHPTLGPLVIGFDPEIERYVAARDAAQAQRVMSYMAARVTSIAAALRAQQAAARHLGYKTPEATQDALLTIERAPRWTP